MPGNGPVPGPEQLTLPANWAQIHPGLMIWLMICLWFFTGLRGLRE